MNERLKPRKKTVELKGAQRPSRIRRDPPAPVAAKKAVRTYPTEREVWIVAVGVVLFALAMSIITIGLSEITSH